jgi:hypothetical protein
MASVRTLPSSNGHPTRRADGGQIRNRRVEIDWRAHLHPSARPVVSSTWNPPSESSLTTAVIDDRSPTPGARTVRPRMPRGIMARGLSDPLETI